VLAPRERDLPVTGFAGRRPRMRNILPKNQLGGLARHDDIGDVIEDVRDLV